MWQFFTGTKSLKVFADDLPALGAALTLYADNIGPGFDNLKAATSTKAAETASALAALAGAIPNDAATEFWYGSTNLKKFSEGLSDLGPALSLYVKNIGPEFDSLNGATSTKSSRNSYGSGQPGTSNPEGRSHRILVWVHKSQEV